MVGDGPSPHSGTAPAGPRETPSMNACVTQSRAAARARPCERPERDRCDARQRLDVVYADVADAPNREPVSTWRAGLDERRTEPATGAHRPEGRSRRRTNRPSHAGSCSTSAPAAIKLPTLVWPGSARRSSTAIWVGRPPASGTPNSGGASKSAFITDRLSRRFLRHRFRRRWRGASSRNADARAALPAPLIVSSRDANSNWVRARNGAGLLTSPARESMHESYI